MSFATTDRTSKVYAPGYFLAENENCERKTRQADSTDTRVKTTDKGGKYLPAGTIYPTNDSGAIGIIYEDVDVTNGDMPCSVVLRGTVYENRLPETLDSGAKTALEALGFKFVAEPEVTRP